MSAAEKPDQPPWYSASRGRKCGKAAGSGRREIIPPAGACRGGRNRQQEAASAGRGNRRGVTDGPMLRAARPPWQPTRARRSGACSKSTGRALPEPASRCPPAAHPPRGRRPQGRRSPGPRSAITIGSSRLLAAIQRAPPAYAPPSRARTRAAAGTAEGAPCRSRRAARQNRNSPAAQRGEHVGGSREAARPALRPTRRGRDVFAPVWVRTKSRFARASGWPGCKARARS